MCSNDSPSQKRDGADEEHHRQIDTDALYDDYVDSIDEIRQTPLPETRKRELAVQCTTVRGAAREGGVPSAELWSFVSLIAEAIGDVESASVVQSYAEVPNDRALATGTPVEEYVLTAAERSRCLAALSELLFTVVETPVASEADGDTEA